MEPVRVRNLVTGRVYLVRGDHYAVSHQDFVVLEDDPVEETASSNADLTEMSLTELRAFARNLGVSLAGARTKAAMIAVLEEHV